MAGEWDVVGNAPAQLQNPWAVKNVAPVTGNASGLEANVLKGVGDAALSGAAKVATGVAGAPIGLANRLIAALTGGDPQMAADAAHEYVNRTFGYDTQTPIGRAIGGVVSGALAPLGQSAQADEQLLEKGGQAVGIPAGETHGAVSELGDIAGTAGAAAPLAAGAQASTEAVGLAAAANPAARAGYRSAVESPLAAGAAGPSGTQALTLQNARIANGRLGAEAGVSPGTALIPGENGTLAAGRAAPGAVYDRVEAGLPTAPLSPAATTLLNNAGRTENVLTAPSEATQKTIDAQRALLTQGPLTGPQVVQTARALRQEGNARISAGDGTDVEQQNLGRAQVGIARALEQHIADTLPPGSPVSLDQFQAARTALAKNYALQESLKGGNVDLQAIARMGRADPDMLTGEFATAARFADEHPKVTGAANQIEVPPSFSSDVGQAARAGGMPQDILGRLFGASGVSALARRALTGSPADAAAAARGAPVSGLAGEFDAIPPGPLNLQPPSGAAGGAYQRPLPLTHGGGQVGSPTASGGLSSLVDDLIAPAGQSVPKQPPAGKKRTLADDLE
jgi:hypothetical protein